MNTAPIERYATWARIALLEAVELRARHYDLLGEDVAPLGSDVVSGRVLTAQERSSRDRLMRRMAEKGESAVLEEAAYTWFNRLVAIRYMEIHNFLPSRTRMLSTEDGRFEPPVLNEALTVNLPSLDHEYVAQAMSDSDDEALYKMLLIAQCDQLADALPQVFQHVGAADELLLPDGLLRQDGFIGRLVADIPLECWESVEILGWMYQYFNRDVRASLQDKKVGAGEIGPATQIYTPEWIVHYLVDNSLGLLWMLNHPDSQLKSDMPFFIEPEQPVCDFLRIDSPEEIRVLDPACGSAHILIYVFELLFKMYVESGYRERDIPELIIANNLSGFEVDERSVQLASLALSLKARDHDRRFFSRKAIPDITLLEPISIDSHEVAGLPLEGCVEFLDSLSHLDQCGSMLNPTPDEINALKCSFNNICATDNLSTLSLRNRLSRAISYCKRLADRYHIVIANPPYRNASKTSSWLNAWMRNHYPVQRSDMCAVFLQRMTFLRINNGFVAAAATNSWMFIATYEKARRAFLEENDITALVQLSVHGYEGIAAQVFALVAMSRRSPRYKGGYIRLSEFDHHSWQAQKTLEAVSNHSCSWFYRISADVFSKVPGSPIAYWITGKAINAFQTYKSLSDIAEARQGFTSGDNDAFLRMWYEISYNKSSLSSSLKPKWFPCDKGGDYRKWYGNNAFVADWEDDGYRLKNFSRSTMRNSRFYLQQAFSWSDVSSGSIAARYKRKGFVFEHCSDSIFGSYEVISGLGALLNSTTAAAFLSYLAPSMKFEVGQIRKIPVPDSYFDLLDKKLIDSCIALSQVDWDSSEVSWDFTSHPLLTNINTSSIEESFENWRTITNQRFETLRAKEEELNHNISRIYNMEDIVSCEVSPRDVSITYIFDTICDIPSDFYTPKGTLGNQYVRTRQKVIRSFVSYAVGCAFGRYSLDKDGLILASEKSMLEDYARRIPDARFLPDEDGILPITDEYYFEDDIVGVFVNFVRASFGQEKLEDNLRYIAESLYNDEISKAKAEGKRPPRDSVGQPRDVIRAYFLKSFFSDHCTLYRKKPIYWLIDSGRKNGFKALIYLHRYNPDTLARVRTDYVHEQQERYRTQLAHLREAEETARGAELTRINREIKKISEQQTEIAAFEERLHRLADQMIELDLDDGVITNYKKLSSVLAKVK